mmetsp:Transcript_80641/g.142806  ORF Transcript_80641/g.142806 Transcript_80641/m.142806 type:complete len:175 (+) Transcript_80641:68-592(+)
MIHCVALLAVLALGAADSQGKCVKGTPECDAQEGLDSQSLLQFKVNLTESDEAESEAGAVSGGTGSKKACKACVKGSWKEVKKGVKADCKKKFKGWKNRAQKRQCIKDAKKEIKKASKTGKCADACDFALLQESADKQQFSATAEEAEEEEEEDMDDEDDEADLEEDKAADESH